MIPKDYKYEFEVDGIGFVATIDPCSWMYPNYGLQVRFTMAEGGGNISMLDKRVRFEDARESDVEQMAEKVHIATCTKEGCNNAAFDPVAHKTHTNRAGLCEECFMAVINARYEKEKAKEDEKIARQERRMYQKGMRFAVDAWVHPPRGDDYQICIYQNMRPTEEQIKAALRKKGSRRLDDYTVRELKG